MAKILKACKNPNCSAVNKKEMYKSDELYCKKCGEKLYHICKGKKCITVLEEEKQQYCERCEAINAQKKEKTKDSMKKIAQGTGALVVAGAALVAKKANPFDK